MTDVEKLAADVLDGRRAGVSRAITLVESSRADHRAASRELLAALT
ncbi:MAG: methylmalonyl Co-A mutase-associated GTPase MeaB, partial [Actinomycetales bacterium]